MIGHSSSQDQGNRILINSRLKPDSGGPTAGRPPAWTQEIVALLCVHAGGRPARGPLRRDFSRQPPSTTLPLCNAPRSQLVLALDALYLGGGFPETNAAALAETLADALEAAQREAANDQAASTGGGSSSTGGSSSMPSTAP